MRRVDPPGCEIRSVPYGDGHRPAAVFTCNMCSAQHVERFNPDGFNPEHVVKRARRAGWQAEIERPGQNRCPACQEARRGKVRPERAPDHHPQQQEENVVTMTTARKAPAAPPLTAEQIAARKPTPEQRGRIREALELYFDAAAGTYQNSYSDQRIGQELNLPWSFVEQIREAAFGPILVTAEQMAMRAEIAKLRSEHEKAAQLVGQANQAVEKATSALIAIQQALAALSTKAGIEPAKKVA